jgi:hypothetical protein
MSVGFQRFERSKGMDRRSPKGGLRRERRKDGGREDGSKSIERLNQGHGASGGDVIRGCEPTVQGKIRRDGM